MVYYVRYVGSSKARATLALLFFSVYHGGISGALKARSNCFKYRKKPNKIQKV